MDGDARESLDVNSDATNNGSGKCFPCIRHMSQFTDGMCVMLSILLTGISLLVSALAPFLCTIVLYCVVWHGITGTLN